MGHLTDAFIGRTPIKLDKIKLYGLAVAFEDDFAIVFLDEDHLLNWYQKLHLNFTSDNKNIFLGGDLVHFFAKEIGFKEYAIVKLDHEWVGVLYNEGNQIDEGQINPMLQKLGVEVKDKENEFHQLNLNDYRLSEAFYWENDSQYVKKANVVKGHRK